MSARICPQCGTRYEGDNRFCTLDGATLVAETAGESLTGTILADRYDIKKKLGEGGMGEVYLAEHVRMKRKVAVKVMRKALTGDPAAVGRFHREAENASQITHPNVAAVYDFGDTGGEGGLVYLAMEFVDGKPLTEILTREGPLNHMRVSDVISQIAEALAAAHTLGILHRDLKPDNVMVAKTRAQTDLIKLLDFGIARVMGRDTQHFTSTGLVVGTPEWMSPEQIAGDHLTARADIYALGLIAFRALTGHGAFGGATSQEVLLAKMTKSPRRLADVRPDVEWPAALQEAMDRVLAINPDARYEDALVFAADFYSGVSQLPMTPEAEAYLSQLSQRSVTPVRMGTLEATPTRGVPTIETPTKPSAALEANVPQLAPTMAMKASDMPEADSGGEPPAEVEGPGDGSPPVPDEPVSSDAVPADSPLTSFGAPPHRKRGPMLAVGGIAAVALIVVAVTQLGGGSAAPAAVLDSAVVRDTMGSDSMIAAAADSAASDSAVAGDSTAAGTLAAGRPDTPRLDSAATRYRSSIFTVTAGRSRGAGFLADTSGLVLTSSSVVSGGADVDVFLDGGRRVRGRVAAVDSSLGLAAVVIPVRHCPTTCAPIPLAPDRPGYRQGDTVMAVMPQTLLSSGARAKGTVTNGSARSLAASVSLASSGAGAPVFLPDGTVLGLARAGGGRSARIVAASVARAFLRTARSAGVPPIDSLLPSWPSRPVSADEMAAAVRRTTQDLESYRVRPRGDFEALVMTPQILVFRKAEADTLRKYYNPGSATTQYCDGAGPCDPLEVWTGLETYLVERRGVVAIQVAPQRTPPPYRGEHKLADMGGRRPVFLRMELARNGQTVLPIESHRIPAVVNPAAYPENQREALSSGFAIFDPMDLLQPDAELELRIQVQGGGNLIRLPIPAGLLDRVRADLASVLR
ncbi:MAG TPA: protein kinase [Gemmatimonadaceae bacterium]